MKRFLVMCIFAATLAAVTSCGIKGPLYLPAETTTSQGEPPLDQGNENP